MNDEYDKTEKPPVEDWAMSKPEIQPETPVNTDNFDITLVGMKSPTAAAVTEDWAMNVPDTSPAIEKASDGWEMPPPVFRISSGKKIDKSNRKTPPPTAEIPLEVQTQPAEIVAPILDIEPQPYISEEFSTNQVAAKTFIKPKSKTSKMIFLILGLLAMLIFAIAFAVGIYFWFFKPQDL